MSKTAIIGGGAAGLMTAAALHEANPSAEIFLLEKNDGLGKKVILSGGGRCNVTTGIADVRTVLTRYPRGGKFLSSAMYQFPPEAVYRWFESHGVPLKTEPDMRVFPQSNDGKDIVKAFEKLLRAPNVHLLCKTTVEKLEKQDAAFHISLKGLATPLIVDHAVLTTGGQAYRHTGSTGDGYAFAMSLGHTLTPLAPSLNAFFTQEPWPASLSGLSFSSAALSSPRTHHAFTGPFLFTHKGMSGPAVFALSSLIAFETYDATHPLEILIDLFPERSLEEIQSSIENLCLSQGKKSLTNVLTHFVPKSLSSVLCRECRISEEKRANETSKKDIIRIAHWLKKIPLHITGRAAGDEFVTAGGIHLKEIDPTTMESNICHGLYFAGEILDIDGFTGGFNLQASWATGHLAGESIAVLQRS